MICVSPFEKVILSGATDLGVRTVEILRYAQDDDFGRLSPMLMQNVGPRPCGDKYNKVAWARAPIHSPTNLSATKPLSVWASVR